MARVHVLVLLLQQLSTSCCGIPLPTTPPILGAPVQSLRIRLCAGGAAADRLRAGAPDSHGALAGGRSRL